MSHVSSRRLLATSMSLMTRMSMEEMWSFGLLTLDAWAKINMTSVRLVISSTDTVMLEGWRYRLHTMDMLIA